MEKRWRRLREVVATSPWPRGAGVRASWSSVPAPNLVPDTLRTPLRRFVPPACFEPQGQISRTTTAPGATTHFYHTTHTIIDVDTNIKHRCSGPCNYLNTLSTLHNLLTVLALHYSDNPYIEMSDTLQELADVPKEFFKDGTQFINRCTKRTYTSISEHVAMHFNLFPAFLSLSFTPITPIGSIHDQDGLRDPRLAKQADNSLLHERRQSGAHTPESPRST